MNVREMIQDINDEVQTAGVKIWWDDFVLLGWISAELNKLTSELDADCFYIHLDPAVTTASGTRHYDLPENFGANFIRSGGERGDKWCCMLNDGTNETELNFIPAVRFHTKNLAGQSNGKPSEYTIVSKSDGKRQIALSPPPDDEYDIDGLYKPTDWKLSSLDAIPPIPQNAAILKYSVLKRIDARWGPDYASARASLAMEFAKSSKGRIAPAYGASTDTYSLIGR